uniref:Uncharacterized protein n=1 Tax=Calcidiscus leptoporus TaxID=127549 RepID=A0A7S0JJF2_9EUKA
MDTSFSPLSPASLRIMRSRSWFSKDEEAAAAAEHKSADAPAGLKAGALLRHASQRVMRSASKFRRASGEGADAAEPEAAAACRVRGKKRALARPLQRFGHWLHNDHPDYTPWRLQTEGCELDVFDVEDKPRKKRDWLLRRQAQRLAHFVESDHPDYGRLSAEAVKKRKSQLEEHTHSNRESSLNDLLPKAEGEDGDETGSMGSDAHSPTTPRMRRQIAQRINAISEAKRAQELSRPKEPTLSLKCICARCSSWVRLVWECFFPTEEEERKLIRLKDTPHQASAKSIRRASFHKGEIVLAGVPRRTQSL